MRRTQRETASQNESCPHPQSGAHCSVPGNRADPIIIIMHVTSTMPENGGESAILKTARWSSFGMTRSPNNSCGLLGMDSSSFAVVAFSWLMLNSYLLPVSFEIKLIGFLIESFG